MEQSPPIRYGATTQVLHWLTAILVVAAFSFGPGGSEQHVYASAQDLDRHIHETLGLGVFTLAVLRVLWRAFDRRPAEPDIAPWMARSAKAVQSLLYALLFALPLTAVTGAWLEGHDLTLLAGLRIAPPIAQSHDLGATIAEIHTWLGDAILWVAGLHAAAGLAHHYLFRDDVLKSMLPRRVMAGRD